MDEKETLDYFLWKNRKSMSRRAFAKQLGISPMALSAYINGKYSPSLVAAMKIHIFSGGQVSLLSLLSESDRKEIDDIKQISLTK